MPILRSEKVLSFISIQKVKGFNSSIWVYDLCLDANCGCFKSRDDLYRFQLLLPGILAARVKKIFFQQHCQESAMHISVFCLFFVCLFVSLGIFLILMYCLFFSDTMLPWFLWPCGKPWNLRVQTPQFCSTLELFWHGRLFVLLYKFRNHLNDFCFKMDAKMTARNALICT